MSDIRCEICETTIYNCTCDEAEETDEAEDPCEIGECDHTLHCISCGSPAENWSEQSNATDDTLCQDEEFCVDCCNCPVSCKDDAHSWDWDDSEIESASESGVELLVECSLCDCHAHFEYSTTYSNVCEN